MEVSHVLDISMNAASGGHLEDRGSGSSLVYAFFTSGTTGKPKGVMVSFSAQCGPRRPLCHCATSVSPGGEQRTCTGPRILHPSAVYCVFCLSCSCNLVQCLMMRAAMWCCRPLRCSSARFTGFIGFSRSGLSDKEKVLSPRRPPSAHR